jgi:hypothetical protein
VRHEHWTKHMGGCGDHRANKRRLGTNHACLTLHVFKSCNKRFVQNVKAPLEPIKLRESNQRDGDIEERDSGVNVSEM